jgi:hypothetical protein
MILATRSSAKMFSFVGKQAGASFPTCSTENGGAKFRKKEWQRIGDEIKVAFIFARVKFVNVLEAQTVCSWVAQLTFLRFRTTKTPRQTLPGLSRVQKK